MILHHEFVKVAKRFGNKEAIIDKTTGRNVPYSKALIASLILARKFRSLEEGYIGLMMPTSAGAMLSSLGLLMSGRVPVMINYSTGAAENAEYAQRKCGFRTIITSRALVEKINCRLVSGMMFIEDIMDQIGSVEKFTAAMRSRMSARVIISSIASAREDDNVVILFTSGSEKDPKAVQLTHRNISSNLCGILEALNLSSDDIIMAMLPLFHVFGQTTNFWLPLLTGMTAVTCANPLEYKNIARYIREEKPSMIAATPVFLAGYLRESSPGDFASLRLVVSGADKLPKTLRDAYLEKHGITVLEGYGTTETSPVISVDRPEANRPGSIGLPLPNVRVRIADIDTGEPLGPGKEGKILVKGDLVMKGYLDDLEETALHIKDGWYDTGDMGMLDEDGYLWHKGRLRRFVKIGGEMVSLVRVETVLEEILPDGTDCCVVEVPDAKKGARIVAAVTAEIDEKKVLKELSKSLPPISLPRQFIVFDELPKMGSGKVDFRTITDMVRERIRNEDNRRSS